MASIGPQSRPRLQTPRRVPYDPAVTSRRLTVAGAQVPSFLYGTAWKELETERLTRLALEAGFRGIDTANQRRHYHEAGVGAAVRAAIADGLVTRDELFIQTKFTSVGGQDARLPYDPGADDASQVRQSFASSLEHLHVERLDSYVLHGPSRRNGLAASDLAVWAAMEALHAAGQTRFIGVSNVDLDQLELLCARAQTPPAVHYFDELARLHRPSSRTAASPGTPGTARSAPSAASAASSTRASPC